MPRENFNLETKTKLAERAGFKCSICNNLTVGPSDEKTSGVNRTGVAAHIAAASPGGRRYNDLPPSYSRIGIENGIWLCATHADLIDGDEVKYTFRKLEEIKSNHEIRIGLEHQGIRPENGIITKVEIANFGLIREGITMEFKTNNLILGANGIGKSLICEMIASLTDRKYLKRWSKSNQDKTNSHCSIYYNKNEMSKFSIAINAKNEISYYVNGASTPFIKAPLTVFYLKEDMYKFRDRINQEREDQAEPLLDETDLLTWLSLYFDLTVSEFSNVINSMERDRKFFINDIMIDEENKDLRIIYASRSVTSFHSFRSFSSGEQQRIILDIALKIATFYAKFQSTVLLLENTAIGIIDQTGLNKLLDIVNHENLGFQFFFTSFQKLKYFNAPGYNINELLEAKEHLENKGRRDNPLIYVEHH